jgi:hypothetical protein
VLTGVYLVVSSSSRRPTWLTITIDSTDVATMRTIKPTAMATIRLLIDCRIIDPPQVFGKRNGNGGSPAWDCGFRRHPQDL